LPISSNIQCITLQNTQKKENVNDMPSAGYKTSSCMCDFFRTFASTK
jgi:hypothetical protein